VGGVLPDRRRHIATSIDALTFDWFNLTQRWGRSKRVDPNMALASLLIHATASISIIAYRVRKAHLEGIGGSS
jgi:hypothetical protein